MVTEPQLSVVVASRGPCRALADSLRSLQAQIQPHSCEVILAVATDKRLPTEIQKLVPHKTVLAGPTEDLVPHLWARGLEAAKAPLVGLTIGSCVPQRDWVGTQLRLAQRHPEWAGFGGPILPPPGGTARDWAAYWVRYSGYLAQSEGEAQEIPGDNAVYRKADLDRDWTERQDGFWEVLFHRRLRERGRRLWFDPNLRVTLGVGAGEEPFASLRFRHGRHFGSTRDLPSAMWRLPAALSAPVLVPLLLARIRRRVRSARPEWSSRFRLALGWTLVYLSSWSLGEASGYIWPGHSG